MKIRFNESTNQVEIVSKKEKISAVFGIFRSTPMHDHDLWVNDQKITLRFRERIEGDFRLGEVSTDNGWVVVRTTEIYKPESTEQEKQMRMKKYEEEQKAQDESIDRIICWIKKQTAIGRGARLRVSREASIEGIMYHFNKDGLKDGFKATCHEVSLAIKKMRNS